MILHIDSTHTLHLEIYQTKLLIYTADPLCYLTSLFTAYFTVLSFLDTLSPWRIIVSFQILAVQFK